jgi:hypothetical protein
MTGMTLEQLAKPDDQRRLTEVADIPVRKSRSPRAKRGGEPH